MTRTVTRRHLLEGMLAALAYFQFGRLDGAGVAYADPGSPASPVPPELSTVDDTLEAFADTMIPGEKRFPDDRVVAGAAEGAGAVQAGVRQLLHMPDAGMDPLLPELATLLNAEATAYAAAHRIALDPTIPAFVSLPFPARTELAGELCDDPAHPDQEVWILLALMVFLAFHTAAFEHTVDAIRTGHPGLARLRFPAPDPDGLYRYPEFSYRRQLATEHPHTTKGGNPA